MPRNFFKPYITGPKWLILAVLICVIMLPAAPVMAEQSSIVSQQDVRRYNLGLGKSVFQDRCIECHGDIESDAPQLHSLDDWQARIIAPLETLVKHALNGHGDMPAKGGFTDLTDREVAAAAAYVVDQGRRLLAASGEGDLSEQDFCNQPGSQSDCTSGQVDNTLLLQMFWMMTGGKAN